MARILFVTDSHVRGTSPVSRRDNFFETVVGKLEWVVDYANRVGADLLLHGGDLFDAPNPSDDVAGRVASILRQAKMPVLVVPGNHDLYGYQIRSLPHTKLGLLERAGVVSILSRDREPYRIGRVSIAGQEYYPGIDQGNPEDWRHGDEEAGYRILVYHGMLLDQSPGFDISHTTLEQAASLTDADLVLAGHYHPGWPSRQIGRTLFWNPGSLARTDASVGNRDRMPQVLLIRIGQDVTVEPVPVEVARPGPEVISIEHLEAEKNQIAAIQSFKETLRKAHISHTDSNLLDLVSDGVEPVVREKALEALGQVTVDREKTDRVTFRRLRLENFQSHKDSILTFDPGVTAIVGPSNSGKTAVLRAIRWATTNQPNGAGMIRQGTTRATVTLETETEEGRGEIVRSRTPSSSGTLHINGTEYKGFARHLPPELEKAHGMVTIDMQGVKLTPCMAMQHDPPFLLALSPSQRALAISPLGGAMKIEAAVRNLGTEITRMATQLRTLEAQKEQLIQQLEQMAGVEEQYQRVRQARELVEKAAGLRSQVEAMQNLLQRYRAALVRRDELQKALSALPDEDTVSRLQQHLSSLNDQLVQLKSIQRRVRAAIETMERLKQELRPDPTPTIDALSRALDTWKQLCKLQARYRSLADALRDQQEAIRIIDARIEELEQKRQDLAMMGAVCPTCKRPLLADSEVASH